MPGTCLRVDTCEPCRVWVVGRVVNGGFAGKDAGGMRIGLLGRVCRARSELGDGDAAIGSMESSLAEWRWVMMNASSGMGYYRWKMREAV